MHRTKSLHRSVPLACSILALVLICEQPPCSYAFILRNNARAQSCFRSSTKSFVLNTASQDDLRNDKETDKLLEQAARLRKEASELESQMSLDPDIIKRRGEMKKERDNAAQNIVAAGPEYIEDSIWSFDIVLEGTKAARAEGPVPRKRLNNIRCKIKEGGLVELLNPTENVVQGLGWSVERGLDEETKKDAFYIRLSVLVDGLEPTVPDGNLYLNGLLGRKKVQISGQDRGEGASDFDEAGSSEGRDSEASGENSSGTAINKRGGITITNGIPTIKVPIKSKFLWITYDGLLAEFKIVGSFTAKPLPPPSSAGSAGSTGSTGAGTTDDSNGSST